MIIARTFLAAHRQRRADPQLLGRVDNQVKLSKHEIIEMIQRAGFEAVEKDTVYNLWYDGDAEEAARFYADTVPDSLGTFLSPSAGRRRNKRRAF